jgi:hypothetical protein
VIDLALLFSVMAEERPIQVSASEFVQNARRQLARSPVAYYPIDGLVPVGEESLSGRRRRESTEEAGLQVREDLPPGISEGSRLWVELFSRAPVNNCANSTVAGKTKPDHALPRFFAAKAKSRLWKTELRLPSERRARWSNANAGAKSCSDG